MLTLLKGGFNSDLHDRIFGEIKKRTDLGHPTLLIVPEQQTVTAESTAAELLPPSAALCFEATNFTRFANSVFRTLGGIAGEYCTRDRKRLIMWRALSELSPFLTMTRSGDITAGMIDRACSAVSELESHGISPEELAEAASFDSIKSNARLGAKVDDLVKIATLYKSLLREKYQDTEDDLTEAVDKLRAHPEYLHDTEIFIDGFSSFTEPQYRIIALLVELCPVTVTLTLPRAERDAYEFTEIADTELRLIGIADRAGVDKKSLWADERYGARPALLYEAERLMFKSDGCVSDDCLGGEIRIIEASTPYDEASFVAADIRRRVAAGASFSDFAIVTRSIDGYRGIIDAALADYGVPHYLSGRRSVDSFEAVKLIYTAYSAVSGGFAREDVMTYAKCGLTGLCDSELDELEIYCESWQISGRGFYADENWNMNPSGYSQKRSNDISALIRINEARQKLMTPLLDFATRVGDAKTVREHAIALFSLLENLEVEKKLAERAEGFERIGEHAAAEDTAKLFETVCNALDVIVSTVGETSASAEAFLVMLRTVFSECSIGSIPSFIDEVTVGAADMLRVSNVKHVYLIGVNNGAFPATVNEGDYFTDRDKDALGAAGLTFRADTVKRAAKENYMFRRVFAAATETVTLLYSRMSSRRGAQKPSEVIGRLCELSGGLVKIERTSDISPFDYIFTPETALERLGTVTASEAELIRSALEKRGYGRLARISRIPTVNDTLSLSENLCNLIYDGDLALTQSRIDSYVSCPLAYFCKYELGLAVNGRAELGANGIGTLVHAILENFFAEIKRRDLDIASLTEDDKKKMTDDAARRYLDALFSEGTVGGARMQVLLARLERATRPVVDGLCRELSASGYKPVFFELRIKSGAQGSPEPVIIKSDERRIFVYGTIDRVDAFVDEGDVYVRVVDYKTGTKVFSPSDLAEGKNLQMFLYLRAIVDTENQGFKVALGGSPNSKILPGGVIYTHTAISDATVTSQSPDIERAAIDEKQKRAGMVLDDERSISAMSREHLPLTFDRSGNISSTDRLYTIDGWQKISETVEESVRRVADGITHGRAEAPKKDRRDSPCDYCDFKHVCRNATMKK